MMAEKGTYVNSVRKRCKSKVVKLIERYDEWQNRFCSLMWSVQFREIGCQEVHKWKKVWNNWPRELLSIHHNQQIQNISLIKYSRNMPCICVYIYIYIYIYATTAVAQWLRYCATSRKVAGLIPDGVIGIFHWHNPSERTMAPGVDSASKRNEYQHFLGVKATGAQGWQPYHNPVPLSCNLGILTSWNPLGHSRPVTGLLYLLYIYACSSFWHFTLHYLIALNGVMLHNANVLSSFLTC
jgi:hypothetical protein